MRTQRRSIGSRRVHLHDHSDLNSGGKLRVSQAIQGGTETITGLVPERAHGSLTGIENDEHPAYALVYGGGESTVATHGAMGTTETIDPASGNYHAGTLDDDCTLTLSPPTDGVACVIYVELTEDGTGGNAPTFDASGGTVLWPGGSPPSHDETADSVTLYAFVTRDGGANWFGYQLGSGGSTLTIQDQGSPLTTAATTLNFVGDAITATGSGATKTIAVRSNEPVTYNDGSGPDLVWEGDDLVMEWVD